MMYLIMTQRQLMPFVRIRFCFLGLRKQKYVNYFIKFPTEHEVIRLLNFVSKDVDLY